MSSYSKYKNIGLFAYAKLKDTAAPAKETRQALSDWNRWAKSNDQCPIYINGKGLTALLKEIGKESFANDEELIDFFKEHLFAKPSHTEKERQSLAELALMNFHQAGFPFATNFCVNNTSRANIRASEPISRIDFNDTEKGLVITEQQTYKELVDKKTGKKDTIRDPEKYHARTTTTSLMTPQGISVQNLEIDCMSRKAAPIFDKRGLFEKIRLYLSKLLGSEKEQPPLTIGVNSLRQ